MEISFRIKFGLVQRWMQLRRWYVTTMLRLPSNFGHFICSSTSGYVNTFHMCKGERHLCHKHAGLDLRGGNKLGSCPGPPQLRGNHKNSKKLLGNIKILFEADNLE